MNNVPIPICSGVKYLDLMLDNNLIWSPNFKNIHKALNVVRFHLLSPLLRSKININNKLIIYKSLYRPLWTSVADLFFHGGGEYKNMYVYMRNILMLFINILLF